MKSLLARRARQARVLAAAGMLSGAVALGCTGEITDAGDSTGAGSGGSGGRTPDGTGYGEDPSGLYDAPSPSPRVARLTHVQWDNTIADLFGIEDASLEYADEFRSDPAQQGFLFDNDARSLSVDEILWKSYQRAAMDIATRVSQDGSLLGRILPAGDGDEAHAKKFIEEFGRRVHRRPLTAAQVDEYLALYRQAPTLYSGLSAFDAGIRLLLEAFLQSPFFLYRIEPSTDASGSVIPLDGYELASRLSYMLWNTMPDEALLGAAEAGELLRADSLAEHARRLLDDPRAEDTIRHFHEQLLEL